MDKQVIGSYEPYRETARAVLDKLNTPFEGLEIAEVDRRITKFGKNSLPESPKRPVWKLFISQFQSPLIYVLIIAGIVVFLIGEKIDSFVIFAVLFINAFVGMYQEGKAEDTLRALKNFTKTETRVRRGAKEIIVPDTDITIGDIILLSEGDKIPCDARIFSERNFQVNEASLTGESIPVEKTSNQIYSDSTVLGDMKNMVFKGTFVVSGNAECVVTAIGVETVIGKLSVQLSSISTDVPLKKNIEKIARNMTLIILLVSLGIFVGGILIGNTVHEMFLVAVAISVSVIPEGLPIVITLVLAIGVSRMSKQNVLVKKLQAVEALGRADVICVDKTGTITKNELMVSHVYVSGNTYKVKGSGYESEGELYLGNDVIDVHNHPDLSLSGKIASLCANATVSYREKEGVWKVVGDPTEASLLILGERCGYKKEILEKEEPLIFEVPFTYKNKYHVTLHKGEKENFMTVVGAPEGIIEMADFVYDSNKGKIKNTEKTKENFVKQLHKMAGEGLRVVAFAFFEGDIESINEDELPPVTLGGLYGLSDTLREGVSDSVALAMSQGIRVVLITGDHKKTAETIASNAGIYKDGDEIITGKDLELLSDVILLERLPKVSVFARVSPQDKLKIVELFKKGGNIVAMTGDGVNDALSLVAADLGVAMGKMGTEVTKEAADIILLDDNFKSIVSGIEEGRSIFSAIKKVLLYLFSTGFGELLVIVFAIFIFLPLPLLPSQIIWLNLVTDSFLVIAFAFEPKQILGVTKSDRKKLKKLIDAVTITRIILMAGVMSIGSLIMFSYYNLHTDIVLARTMALTLLAVYQWINVWNCRSEKRSIFAENPFSNMFFVYALILVIFLHGCLLYVPFMQNIFRTVPLSASQWGIILLASLPLVVIEEIRKFISMLFSKATRTRIVE